MRLSSSGFRIPLALGLLVLILVAGTGIHRLAHRDYFDIAFGLAGGNDVTKLQVIQRLPGALLSGRFPASVRAIEIDIPFEHLLTIREDRRQSLSIGVLLNPQEVPARISVDGNDYRARIRLKGDLYPHWSDANRWSFRIELKGGKTLDGFSAFSLQQAGNRQFPHDQLFQFWLREVGLATPRFEFYRVFVNGTDWGVMLAEEHMTHHFLERNGRKEAPIVKFGNELKWYYDAANRHIHDRPGSRYGIADVNLYQESRYRADDRMRALYGQVVAIHDNVINRSSNQLGTLNTELFAKALAAAWAWNNTHTLHYPNSRFYLNPYTLQLEPVTTDQAPPSPRAALGENAGGVPGIYRLFAGDPEFTRVYLNVLDDLEQALPKLESEYQRLCAPFPLDCPESNIVIVRSNLKAMQTEGADLIANALGTASPSPIVTTPTIQEKVPVNFDVRYPRHVTARYRDGGRLDLFNPLFHDIEVERISLTCVDPHQCEPRDLISEPILIPPGSNGALPYGLTMDLPMDGLQPDQRIVIQTKLGEERQAAMVSFSAPADLENPFLDTSGPLPAFIREEVDGYRIPTGSWVIDAPIILAPGKSLTIDPGVEIYFAPDALLLLRGPLLAAGEKDSPVVLQPASDSWKGIAVVNANAPSRLHYVKIRNTSGVDHGALQLTGAVTFYNSDIHLSDSVFDGTRAEDALNIVNSRFSMSGVNFLNTVSDGFDCDFSDGELTDVSFTRIGGDGLDTSGSTVEARMLRFEAIHDKAVSAGEESHVTITDMTARDVGTAVVSKDGASLHVTGLDVRDARLHAGMAYRKKPIYGGATMTISDLTGHRSIAVQHDSTAVLDGEPMPETAIDVDWLYETGPMKKSP